MIGEPFQTASDLLSVVVRSGRIALDRLSCPSRAVAVIVALLALMATVVSGCGENSTAARLHSRLLAIGDLPAGWAAVATRTNTAPKLANTPCVAGPAKHPNGWS